MSTIFSTLRESAQRHWAKTCIHYRDVQVSYGRLFSVADTVAARFLGANESERRKVGILSSRDADFMVALLGLMQADAIAVPLSPALREGELAQLVDELA